MVVSAAAALAFMLSFPPWYLGALVVLPPALLALAGMRARSALRLLICVWFTHFAMWLWVDRWVIGVSAAGYPFLAAYMAAWPALFAWVSRRVFTVRIVRRVPCAVLLPILWVGLETLRGLVVCGGYPWFLLAHPLIEWPLLAQSADLFGGYFLSFLAAMASGAALDVLHLRAGQVTRRFAVVSVLLVAAIWSGNLIYGVVRLHDESALAPGPVIVAIQTNLPQSNKIGWSPEEQVRDVASFLELTRDAFHDSEGKANLILWPETMLPVRGLEPETIRTLQRYQQMHEVGFINDAVMLQEELGTPLVIGAPCYLGLRVSTEPAWEWDRNYNSAYLVEGDFPFQRYDKVFLTPFGEVIPYVSGWPWLEKQLLAIGAPGMSFSLDRAATAQILCTEWETPSGRNETLCVGTPICFEDTVGWVCRDLVYQNGEKRADLLLNLSNDGWFGGVRDGKTNAGVPNRLAGGDEGRAQHAQIARLRCIENRVPMVRCANTGLSVAFDSLGSVVGKIGDGRYGTAQRSGRLISHTRLDERETLYGRIGDAWAWGCLVLLIPVIGMTLLTRAKENST